MICRGDREIQWLNLSRIAAPKGCRYHETLKAQHEVYTALKALISYYGANYDASRADWIVITKLLKWRFPDISIAKALFYSSEANLLSRQADVGYYLKWTFTNAYNELIKQGVNIPPLSHEFSRFIEKC